MPRFSFSSLRVRLFLLVLCAVIPALGMVLYTASEQRRSVMASVAEDVAQFADLAAGNYDNIFVAAHDMLITLTHFEMHSREVSTCRAMLVDVQEHFEKYTNFGYANPDGEIICASLPPITSVNVTDRSWFRRAKATRQFAVGDHEINPLTSQPSISFAYPILNPSGTVKTIIFATMSLKWLQSFAAGIKLPARATLDLIDRDGATLVRYPEPDRSAAKSLPEAIFFNTIRTKGHGVAEAIGSDGATHLFGFTQISAAPQGNLYVIVSVLKDDAFAEPNRLLRQNLLILGLLALAALVTTWIGGDIVFLRRMNALLSATKQIAAANFNVRTRLLHSKDELGQLARAFDEMAEELEKSEKIKADFASMIVHDLRSPLNNIVGIASMIEEGLLGSISEEQKKWLGKIKVNSGELLLLINDFLDLSKIEAGHIELVKEPVDLNQLIKNTVESFLVLAKNRNISLRNRADPALPALEADPRRLAQVVSNLVSNAIKFTPEGGEIEIGAEQENHAEIKLWVKDNGVGIPPEEMEKLFQKYAQTSSGKTSPQQGTGLGLLIVKTIVESHGGTVGVESVVGQGSTFILGLPVSA